VRITGYFWKFDDTPSFVAGRVEEARREYLEPLLPRFLDALVRFTEVSAGLCADSQRSSAVRPVRGRLPNSCQSVSVI